MPCHQYCWMSAARLADAAYLETIQATHSYQTLHRVSLKVIQL